MILPCKVFVYKARYFLWRIRKGKLKYIYQVPENIQYRMIDLKDPPIAIATYSFKESVTVKVNLQPGNYVIIPTPYYPGVPGEYLLRCISAENLNIR